MKIKYLASGLALFSLSLISYSLYFSNSTGISNQKLIDLTNSQRAQNHLAALSENPKLDAAAQLKLNDMISHGYFAHTSPQGVSPWYFFGKVGYEYQDAGENLALNFSDASKLEQAWMASSEHRNNILNPNFDQIGIAAKQAVINGKVTDVVVEFLAKPSRPLASNYLTYLANQPQK